MTPPDAPDAPRDLLDVVEARLSDTWPPAPEPQTVYEWLSLLVQRVRTAEAVTPEKVRVLKLALEGKRPDVWWATGDLEAALRSALGASRPGEPQP